MIGSASPRLSGPTAVIVTCMAIRAPFRAAWLRCARMIRRRWFAKRSPVEPNREPDELTLKHVLQALLDFGPSHLAIFQIRSGGAVNPEHDIQCARLA